MSDKLLTLPLNEKGYAMPKTIDEAFRVAKAHSMPQSMVPDRFAGKPEAIFSAMQFAAELGLPPLTSLRQMAVIKGTPSLFGDLPLALVRVSGLLEDIEEFEIDSKYNEINLANKNLGAEVFGCVCRVKRKGDRKAKEAYFTQVDAKKAGLWGTNTWAKFPQLMLKYRARSIALKDNFSDVLNGVAIAEYDFNETTETIDAQYTSIESPKDSPAPQGSAALREILDTEGDEDGQGSRDDEAPTAVRGAESDNQSADS